MKKYYWAVGNNFNYGIITTMPNRLEWPCELRFNTLKEAKKQIRFWINSDRWHLAQELKDCMKLKEKDFL